MDTKTIKIDAQVYNELDRYRGKGETFTDAVRKVLTAAECVRVAADKLGPLTWVEYRPEFPREEVPSGRE